jgi:hypothetical protein
MEKAPLTPTTVERARDVAMLSRITLNSSRAMSLIDSVGAASPSQVLVVPGQKAELQGDAFFIIPRSIFLHHSISSQNSIQAFASRPQVLSMTVKWKPGESRRTLSLLVSISYHPNSHQFGTAGKLSFSGTCSHAVIQVPVVTQLPP